MKKKIVKEIHFKSVDSTSTYIKKHYEELENLTFVSADYQSNGHGRMGRSWKSKSGENLMFSFIVKDPLLIKKFSSISISSAVATLITLKSFGLENVTIKWPNDVYVNDKKITGILLESISLDNEIKFLVIGIGVNLNVKSFDEILKTKATSYYLETNKTIDINMFKTELFKNILNILEQIKINNDDYLVIANKYNYLYNKEVYGEINNEKKLIKVLEINKDNSLHVLVDGVSKDLYYGELTFHINE